MRDLQSRAAAGPYRDRSTQRRIEAAGVERTSLTAFQAPTESVSSSPSRSGSSTRGVNYTALDANPVGAQAISGGSPNTQIGNNNTVNINNTTSITNINTSTYAKSKGTKVGHPWWGYGHKKPKSKLSVAISFYSGSSAFAFHLGHGHYYSSGWGWWHGYFSHLHAWSFYPTYYCTSSWWHPTPWRPRVVHHHHWHHWSSPKPVVQHVYVDHRSSPTYAPPQPCPYTPTEAWYVLADESPATALAAFGCLAKQHPGDGLTLIGLALAEALAGSDQSAVSAMRHAVRNDPRALLLVPQDEDLDERLFLLLGHYTELAAMPEWRVDGAFMLASLRTAVGDLAGAHFAINEAINRGDQHPAAMELRDLLSRKLQESMFNSP